MTANPTRRRVQADRRAALNRWQRMDSYREAGARRVALIRECVLLGWYPAATPLETVLTDLALWASDPAYFASLPYPVCCRPDWEWGDGEDVSVWHAGRLLAVVTRADGSPVVTRFDLPTSRGNSHARV